MPNVSVHLLLAERTLGEWSRAPRSPPFPAHESAIRNAFFQGAFGPDLGYFPGGFRLFSDLAHTIRSGDLSRTLLGTARTPLERAFAWGWITHVVADRVVHGLVGRAAWELRHGRPDGFLSADADLITHIRVETGLDVWVSRSGLRFGSQPLGPVFDDFSIRFLQAAYEETYAVQVSRRAILASHLVACRMASRALGVIGYLGTELSEFRWKRSASGGVPSQRESGHGNARRG